MNGDGKVDLIFQGNVNTFYVSLSTGSGFYPAAQWLDHGDTFHAGQAQYADVNGDGKADLIFQGNVNTFYVSLSTGSGFTPAAQWLDHGDTFNAGQAQYTDVNGDGKVDLIFQGNVNEFYVSLSTGSGFAPTSTWMDHGESFQAGRAQYADMNGDGKADLIFQSNSNEFIVSTSNGPFPDKLISTNNGVGGTTTITYKPSSQYDNDVFPFILQTVSSISVDDGNGNTSTTDYTYSGGLLDYETKELRGFEYVKVTDPAGTTTETWFKQNEIFK
ncbi:MAG: hypothetical protein GY791_06175, partial [Alphaproteobacteria bacterium]|nr:hypothetical protein [Alphaproteobacteria bacterium]